MSDPPAAEEPAAPEPLTATRQSACTSDSSTGMKRTSDDVKRQWATIWDRAAPVFDSLGQSYFAHAGRRLAEHVRPEAGAHVLDIACGRGAVLFALMKRAGKDGHGLGVDISPGMVELVNSDASRQGLGNVQAAVMDAEYLELPDQSFDIVCAAFVLAALPNPERAVAEFHRVLRVGGRLGLGAWGANDPRWAWESELIKQFGAAGPAVTRHFDKLEDLNRIISGAGFTELHPVTESWVIRFASEDETWRFKWTYGLRRHLDAMAPSTRQRFRGACAAMLPTVQTPQGYERTLVVNFVVASRAHAPQGDGT
jgi:ubiquinone/menaquinone biosynthesis C-methylase UbiE